MIHTVTGFQHSQPNIELIGFVVHILNQVKLWDVTLLKLFVPMVVVLVKSVELLMNVEMQTSLVVFAVLYAVLELVDLLHFS